MRSTRLLFVAAVGIQLTFTLSVLGSPTIIDIGTPGSVSRAYGMNDVGQVVGYYADPGQPSHAFVWDTGSLVDLGTPGGNQGGNPWASGINVGEQIACNSGGQAYRWSQGQWLSVGSLGGGSQANGIDLQGEVTGFAYLTPGGTYHAFVYRQGSMVDLGTLGGANSVANRINDLGEVVGRSDVAGVTHAFVYRNGAMNDLGTLGGTHSEANDIDSTGAVIAGWADTPVARHASLYSNGHMTDLGSFGGASEAAAVNDLGQVVGWSDDSLGVRHAFLYDNGSMIDLNTLVSGSGWTLERAMDINNLGQIVGWGRNPAGEEHAFLIVPEPATLSLLALGSLAVLRPRRK